MQISSTERKIRKNLRDIITADDYEKIVKRLISIATDGKRDLDAVNAAKVIIERLEGQIPQAIPVTNEDAPKVSREHFLGKNVQ